MPLACCFTFGLCAFCECMIPSEVISGHLRSERTCFSAHPSSSPSHSLLIHSLTFDCFELFETKRLYIGNQPTLQDSVKMLHTNSTLCYRLPRKPVIQNFQHQAENLKVKHYPAYQDFELVMQQQAPFIPNKVGAVMKLERKNLSVHQSDYLPCE